MAGRELRETGSLARHRYGVVVVPGRLRVAATMLLWYRAACASPLRCCCGTGAAGRCDCEVIYSEAVSVSIAGN